jgi:hypothetical protein
VNFLRNPAKPIEDEAQKGFYEEKKADFNSKIDEHMHNQGRNISKFLESNLILKELYYIQLNTLGCNLISIDINTDIN